MSRKRYLSTAISTDKRVAQLAQQAGLAATTLYTWAIPAAGDDGTLTADPEELLSIVVPALAIRNLITIADVETFIAAALELGLVRRVGDRLKFPEKAFYGYQSYIGSDRRKGTETNGWGPHNEARRQTAQSHLPEEPSAAEPRVSAQNAADKNFAPDPPQNPAPLTSSSSLTSSSPVSFNSERLKALSVRAPTRETPPGTGAEDESKPTNAVTSHDEPPSSDVDAPERPPPKVICPVCRRPGSPGMSVGTKFCHDNAVPEDTPATIPKGSA